jgi:hypothetical protein
MKLRKGDLMKNRSVRTALAAVLALVFLFACGKTTLALWKTQTETVNEMVIAKASLIAESPGIDQLVYPGQKVEKKESFRNTGNVDVAVRVKAEKAWGSKGADGIFVADQTLGVENIVVHYNTEHWMFNDMDQYYYYKGILAPNQPTPPVIEAYEISTAAGRNNSGKQALVKLRGECVQAEGDGIAFWGMTFQQLGITYNAPAKQEGLAKVEFVSPQKGFEFQVEKGNLFVNCGLMVPAVSYSQLVQVENKYSEDITLYLRAEDAQQAVGSDEQRALVARLLQEFVTIVITKQDGTKVYEGPVWGRLNTDVGSMKDDYNLGKYQPGQSAKLNVTLSLDKEVDNKYSSLLARVRWVFVAEGDTPPTTPPVTTTNPATTTTTNPAATTTNPATTTTNPASSIPTTTRPATTTTATQYTTVKHTTTWKYITPTKAPWPSQPPKGIVPPYTGGDQYLAVWIELMVVSGLILVALWVVGRREKKLAS